VERSDSSVPPTTITKNPYHVRFARVPHPNPFRDSLRSLQRGAGYLLATQVMDGVGGGLFGLLHPYLVADLAFGSGRFNVVMGLTASCFGLGATMSNFLGQLVVEHFGHATSLTCSLVISFVPVVLFAAAMPETLGIRGHNNAPSNKPKEIGDRFVQMT